jgi:hypothetical protein
MATLVLDHGGNNKRRSLRSVLSAMDQRNAPTRGTTELWEAWILDRIRGVRLVGIENSYAASQGEAAALPSNSPRRGLASAKVSEVSNGLQRPARQGSVQVW